MTRSHVPVVVYGEQLQLPAASVDKLEAFERWLIDELAKLEARWSHCAAPRGDQREQARCSVR